jgi:F-type H+-transporting ATPase subunit delta
VANEVAAKRYAQAAFELAVESNAVPAWSEGLARIAHFLSDGDAARALQNGRVSRDVKHRLIDAGLRDLARGPLNLAHLLVNKGRVGLAVQIAEQFTRMVEEHQGVARARAVTAVQLSEADKQALVQRLRESTGRQVVLETDIDPTVLGGVVVQIGDRLIDGSTRARLDALRESLVGAVR